MFGLKKTVNDTKILICARQAVFRLFCLCVFKQCSCMLLL